MQRDLLIGIAAPKGAGKSTVAEMLAEIIPDIEILAWADALKNEVADMIDETTGVYVSRDEMEALKGEVYGPLFQGWGAYRRRQDTDYWIHAWDGNPYRKVIVPDTRHHNEADFIKAEGGVLLYIDGPSRWEGDTRSSAHESERHIRELRAKSDYRIRNTGTLESLREQVEQVAAKIVGVQADAGVPA